VSCDGLHGDLSPHGNIIGKNAIECYCQIILYEPKVSTGCVTFVFLEFHEAHSAQAVNRNATIASSHRSRNNCENVRANISFHKNRFASARSRSHYKYLYLSLKLE